MLWGKQAQDGLGGPRPSAQGCTQPAGREGASGDTSTTRAKRMDRDAPHGVPLSTGPGPNEGGRWRGRLGTMSTPRLEGAALDSGRNGAAGLEDGAWSPVASPSPALGRAPRPPAPCSPSPPPIPEPGRAARGLSHSQNHLLPSFPKELS